MSKDVNGNELPPVEEEVDFTDEVMSLADDEQLADLPEVEPIKKSEELKTVNDKQEELTDEDVGVGDDDKNVEPEPAEVEPEEESDTDEDEQDGQNIDKADEEGELEEEEEEIEDPRDAQIRALQEALNGNVLPVVNSGEQTQEESTDENVPAGEQVRQEASPPAEMKASPININLAELSDEDKDKIAVGDLSPLQDVLNKALVEVGAYNQQQMAELIPAVVDNHTAISKQINDFWDSEENQDLAPLRNHVIQVAGQNDDPTKSVGEVLTDAATRVRKALKMVEAKKNRDKRLKKKPAFASGNTARRTMKADDKATPIVSEQEQSLLDVLEGM